MACTLRRTVECPSRYSPLSKQTKKHVDTDIAELMRAVAVVVDDFDFLLE